MSGCCICEDKFNGLCLAPKKYDLRIERGMISEFDAILTNAYNEPFDITLDTVVFTVRDVKAGTVKIQKINLPTTHIDGPQGRTRFLLEANLITETELERNFEWTHEVRRITPAGEEFVHIEGTFFVVPEVGS